MSNVEKKIENDIKKYIESLPNSYIEKIHGGSQFQSVGIPDLIACVNGRFVGIEVKRPKGGVVSKVQQVKINLINMAGGVALVATSVDEVKFELIRQGVIKSDT